MILVSAIAAVVWAAGVQPVEGEKGAESAASVAAGTTEEQRAFEARLEAIDARMAEVHSLRASFVQRKRTPLLKRPIESTGTVLVKGDRLRWETREPARSTLATDGAEIRIFYPDARVVEVYEAAGDLRVVSGTPLPRLAVLREQFTLREISPASMGVSAEAERYVAVELLPIRPELQAHVETVRVLIDSTLACVRKLNISDREGESTEIEFKEIQLNTEIRDDELALVVPTGTRVSRPGPPGKPSAKSAAERGRGDAPAQSRPDAE